MRRAGLGLLLVICAAVGACGYFRSGTWTDDPDNFARAWGYSKPNDVTMIHSWYWRSAHFTREESYFFQFRWHEELFTQLVEANRLQAVNPVRGAKTERQFCFQRPAWFAPDPDDAYEIWRCGDGVNCWLFRARRSNDLYFYACQL